MRAFFGTKRLCCAKSLVEIITRQHNPHPISAKGTGFVDLLLRRCHRHKNRAGNTKMFAGKGNALRMIARAGADKFGLLGLGRAHFAHRGKGTAQFIAAHR